MAPPRGRPGRGASGAPPRLGASRGGRAHAGGGSTNPPNPVGPPPRGRPGAPPRVRVFPTFWVVGGEAIALRRRPRRPARLLGRRLGVPLGGHRRRAPGIRPERLRRPPPEHEATVMTAADMIAADGGAGGPLKVAAAAAGPAQVRPAPYLTASSAALRPRVAGVETEARTASSLGRMAAAGAFYAAEAGKGERSLAPPASLAGRVPGGAGVRGEATTPVDIEREAAGATGARPGGARITGAEGAVRRGPYF